MLIEKMLHNDIDYELHRGGSNGKSYNDLLAFSAKEIDLLEERQLSSPRV